MTNYEIARDIVDSEWKKNANLNPYIIEKKIQEALDQKDSTIQVLREEVERILTEKSCSHLLLIIIKHQKGFMMP